MKKFYAKKITNYKEINLTKCVTWMYNWWGKIEGWSPEKIETYLKFSFNDNKLPQTIIAFNENNEEVAMCQITVTDLDCRPDIYPYIANLYVDEKYRHQGIVKLLLDKAIQAAKESHLTHLYLFTSHVGLYEKYGWRFLENIETYLDPHIQKLYKFEIKY